METTSPVDNSDSSSISTSVIASQIKAESVNKILNSEQYLLFLKFMVAFAAVFAALGIPTNVLNLRAFFLLGLKDGVTVCFFTLSLIDSFYLLVVLFCRAFTLAIILEEEGVAWMTVHPTVFTIFSADVVLVTSAVGLLSVTFLAVARCTCICMPLHFRHVFTKSRCVACNLVFVVICVIAYVPNFAHMGVQRLYDASKNATRVFLWFSPQKERIKDAIWLVSDTILPFVVQVILIACVVVMIYKLRESARFRQGAQRGKEGDAAGEAGARLSPRDRRVVFQVLLISIIYIVANSVKVYNSMYTQIDTEFDMFRLQHDFYLMMGGVRGVLESLNASVNFFVYYYFNSAFRNVCFNRDEKNGRFP